MWRARTQALHLLLARDPDAALALAVAGMIVRSRFRSDLAGVGVAAHPAVVDDLNALQETRGMLDAMLPAKEADVLGWCLTQSREALLFALGVLVAESVDLTHERGTPSDRRRQTTADELASALNLDMRQFWAADADYWTRLPKSELLAALNDARALVDLPDGKGEASLKGVGQAEEGRASCQGRPGRCRLRISARSADYQCAGRLTRHNERPADRTRGVTTVRLAEVTPPL